MAHERSGVPDHVRFLATRIVSLPNIDTHIFTEDAFKQYESCIGKVINITTNPTRPRWQTHVLNL